MKVRTHFTRSYEFTNEISWKFMWFQLELIQSGHNFAHHDSSAVMAKLWIDRTIIFLTLGAWFFSLWDLGHELINALENGPLRAGLRATEIFLWQSQYFNLCYVGFFFWENIQEHHCMTKTLGHLRSINPKIIKHFVKHCNNNHP